MSRFLFAVLFFLSNLAFAQEGKQELFCDIDKVQNKDWSEDMLGYQKDNYQNIFPLWLSKAESGNPKHQFYVAKAYYFGEGIEKNLEKSLYWYTKSSDQNYPVAKNNLGLIYEDGEGVQQDLNKSFNLVCNAALQGVPVSQHNIGRYYQYGIGTDKNPSKAIGWHKEAVKNGNLYSLILLSKLHIGLDNKKAFEYIKLSVKKAPSAEGFYSLGLFYKFGWGVGQNLEKSIEWLEKAADLSYVDSLIELWAIYATKDYGLYNDKLQLKYLKKAAHLGEKKYAKLLGGMYKYGYKGAEKNHILAEHWYLKFAEDGDSESMYQLSDLYLNGEKHIQDHDKSLFWAEKAVSGGELKANLVLAQLYRDGNGVIKDLGKSINYNKKILTFVDDDNEKYRAAHNIGYIYSHVYKIPDLDKAKKWYKLAFSYKNATIADISSSAKKVGEIFLALEDFKEAEKWFKKAYYAGSKESEQYIHLMNNLDDPAMQFMISSEIITLNPNNHENAIKYLEKSANQGYLSAQVYLGTEYLTGIIVPKDYKVALYWLKKAANQGSANAQNALGVMFHNGYGVNIDLNEAIKWYQFAANQWEEGDVKSDEEVLEDSGITNARFNIGNIYLVNKKDYSLALKSYMQSAKYNHAYSMFAIALMYREGKGVSKDKDKEFEWMLKSAELNSRMAQYNIANMYFKGYGVEKNNEKMVLWLKRAKENKLDPNYNSSYDAPVAELIDVQLAKAYREGVGIKKDMDKAMKSKLVRNEILDDMAKFGNSKDKLNIATEYEKKYKAYAKAFYWYSESAKLGETRAQRKVGDYYSRVEYGVERDFVEAEKWYKKAIKNKDIDSSVSLAWLYILSEISPGVKNPVYNPKKGVEMFLDARNKGSIVAVDYLVYVYRYGIGTDKDIHKSLEMIKELVVKYNKNKRKTDDLFIKALEIQTENGIYNDDVLMSKGMEILISLAQSGDVKKQFKLGKVYLTKDFKFHHKKDGMHWIEKASKKSIEANQHLSGLYFGFEEGGIYNHKKHGDALKRAVNLFETKEAVDYSYYKDYYHDGLIYLYQQLANYYSVIDAPELAEINLRKAAKYYTASKDNKYEIQHKLVLANSSDDLQASKEFFNKFIEKISKNEITNIEDVDYFYRAVINLHQKYRDENRHQDAAEFLIGLMAKFKDGAEYYKPILTLEIARDYSSLKNYKKIELYLEKYKEAKENIKPGLLDNLLSAVIYSEKDRKKINDAVKSLERPIESILFGVLDGILLIYYDNIDDGYNKIITSLDTIKKRNIPIRARDLDFSVEPIEMLLSKGEYEKAAIIIEKVVSFYKESVALRASNNYKVSAKERGVISDAISEYIYASSMARRNIKDKGFEVMQLSSGLTLSDSVVKTISRKQLSGTNYIKSKQLSFLESGRRDLIKKKFSILSLNQSTYEIDEKLDLLDVKILNLSNQIGSPKKEALDLFISSLDSTQKSVPDDDALITMLIGSKRSHVWLITSDDIYRHDSNLTKLDVANISKKLLGALNPASGSYSEFPLDASSKLYALLIEPFEGQLNNINRLVISPDVSLSNIPFSILTKDLELGQSSISSIEKYTTRGIDSVYSVVADGLHQVDWLINNYAIATVPSVYSYIELQKQASKQSATLESFIGIGNPTLLGDRSVMTRGSMFGEQDIRGNVSRSLGDLSSLPETEGELIDIASMFSTSKILTAENATEANVRSTDLSKFDVIAFATHALVSNEIDELFEPSLVLTPIQEDNPENDGLLTASEVSELDMDAEIVLLSACNTASSFGESNSQGLSGLANSFFNAGAKSLLVSYWSVISESAVDITTRIFKPSNEGRSYAHKHRNAVLDLLQNSKDTYKLHPSYWAPFAVIGVN